MEVFHAFAIPFILFLFNQLWALLTNLWGLPLGLISMTINFPTHRSMEKPKRKTLDHGPIEKSVLIPLEANLLVTSPEHPL
jgi:hypothetical protein